MRNLSEIEPPCAFRPQDGEKRIGLWQMISRKNMLYTRCFESLHQKNTLNTVYLRWYGTPSRVRKLTSQNLSSKNNIRISWLYYDR